MPLYGTNNVPSLVPGDWLTLLDGTETLPQNAASIAFVRGYSPSANDGGITFNATNIPANSVIDIQAAPDDVAAEYTTTGQLVPDANGNAAYTDEGRSPFYRAEISSSTAATGAKVKANR